MDGEGLLTIRLFKECDIADQSLLYAILAMCLDESKGKVLKRQPLTEKTKDLRDQLKIQGKAVELDSILIKTTKFELNEELGKIRDKKNREWIIESLSRLRGIGFEYEDKEKTWGFNLLSYYYDKTTDEITIKGC